MGCAAIESLTPSSSSSSSVVLSAIGLTRLHRFHYYVTFNLPNIVRRAAFAKMYVFYQRLHEPTTDTFTNNEWRETPCDGHEIKVGIGFSVRSEETRLRYEQRRRKRDREGTRERGRQTILFPCITRSYGKIIRMHSEKCVAWYTAIQRVKGPQQQQQQWQRLKKTTTNEW